MKKYVVLYSGGLDSFIAYHYLQKALHVVESDIVLLRIKLGHEYIEKEELAIENLGLEYKTVTCDYLTHFPEIDKENFIMPARNLILASIASAFGETIVLSAYKGELHSEATDKNEKFMNGMGLLASYVNKTDQNIMTPFLNLDKIDIVRWGIHYGFKNEMLKTTSCFDPSQLHCGDCVACMRRAVAMAYNGIYEYHGQNPFESPTGLKYKAKHNEAKRTGDFNQYALERIELHEEGETRYNVLRNELS